MDIHATLMFSAIQKILQILKKNNQKCQYERKNAMIQIYILKTMKNRIVKANE